MKHKWIYLTLVMMVLLGGCRKKSSHDEVPGSIQEEKKGIDVVLLAEKDTYTIGEDVVLVIENKGDESLTTSMLVLFEVQKKESWYEFPVEDPALHQEMAVVIGKNGKHEQVIGAPPLKKGHYRLLKEVYVGGEKRLLSAEIDVKK